MILYRWQSIPVTAVSHTCIPWGNDKYCFNLLASKDIFVYHVFLNVFFCLFNPVYFFLVYFGGIHVSRPDRWVLGVAGNTVNHVVFRQLLLQTLQELPLQRRPWHLRPWWYFCKCFFSAKIPRKSFYCMIGIFLGFFKLISNLFEKNAKAEAMPPQRSEWGRLEMHSSAHHIRRWNECP